MSDQSYSELVQSRDARAQLLRDEFEKSLPAVLDDQEMVALQRGLVIEVRDILKRFHDENILLALPHQLDISTGSMIQPKVECQVEAIALTAFARERESSLLYFIVNRRDECSLVRGYVSARGTESRYVQCMHRFTVDEQLPRHRDIPVEHLRVILDAMRQLLVDQQVSS